MDRETTNQALDLGVEFAEVALDQLFTNDILKEIPILGSAVGVARLSKTVSDHIFLTKIRRFLLSLNDISLQEKAAFQGRLEQDNQMRKKAGECLVLICNRLDDMEKADMVGICFKAFVRDKINLETFLRLAAAIDLGFIEDLRKMSRSGKEPVGYIEPYLFTLARTGLVDYTAKITDDRIDHTEVGMDCEISALGTIFIQIMDAEIQKNSKPKVNASVR